MTKNLTFDELLNYIDHDSIESNEWAFTDNNELELGWSINEVDTVYAPIGNIMGMEFKTEADQEYLERYWQDYITPANENYSNYVYQLLDRINEAKEEPEMSEWINQQHEAFQAMTPKEKENFYHYYHDGDDLYKKTISQKNEFFNDYIGITDIEDDELEL